MTRTVIIPPTLTRQVLAVIVEFLGPDTTTGKLDLEGASWPTVELDGHVCGYFCGESDRGLEFATTIEDLACRVEGFLEAQEDTL
jgi:hypothetical protein